MKYKISILILSSLLLSLLLSVPTAAAIGEDICHDINDWFSTQTVRREVLDCGKEDIVSFQGFQGGLQAPTGEGLSETLTRAKTARDFIRDTLNFALSFLGIIALAVVIYGGFLYVTAAGNEEQSGKGKKSITYAAVGIIIIIGSFALVNTLLTSVGSKEGDRSAPVRGVGQEGTNIDQQTIYNTLAEAINSSLNDFINAYKNLVTTDSLIKKAKNVERPEKRENNSRYLSEVTSIISQIKSRNDTLSKTHIVAKKFLDGWLAQTASKNLLAAEFEEGQLKKQFDEELDIKSKINASAQEDFVAKINNLLGGKGTPGRLEIVTDILGDLATQSAQAVIKGKFLTEKDLNRVFSGLAPSATIKDILEKATSNLKKAKALGEDTDQPELVIDVIESLDRLFIIVKNLQFVFVKIRTTAQEGNAPLIVELSGLESRDPTGATITDDRYEWDSEGVIAQRGSSVPTARPGSVECTSKTGSTIICTYKHPGTYIASLTIKSNDPSRVATGRAFLPITVLPSVARISLKASVASLSEELRKYEQDATGKWNLIIDKGEFQATSEEATKGKGVTFDASATQAGSGASIQKPDGFKWSFGDGTAEGNGEKIEHVYKVKGKFPLKLEVTDSGNRKDRKVVNVFVSSIAARTTVNKTEAQPDEILEFDGSISRSDKGSISSYIWKIIEIKADRNEEEITNLQNKITMVGRPNAPVLRVKFKNPGAYKVLLEVNDGTSNATHTDTITIKSRRPRANFTTRSCPKTCPDPTKPGIIELDASASFDPDRDELIYKWSLFDDRGNELQKDTSFEVLEGKPIEGKEAKKIKVKFRKTGTYRIRLEVKDDLAASLQQTDIRDGEINIPSIVEIEWKADIKIVEKMQEGKATFIIEGQVRNANRVQIDFGDQTTPEEQPLSQEGPTKTFKITHEYREPKPFLITAKAISDEGNGENTISKRVYVSAGENPLAVLEVSVDDIAVALPEPSQTNPKPALEVIRGKVIKFDASKSINSKGNMDKLKYSWDFGDRSQRTGEKVTKSYTDRSAPDAPYEVKLTVSEEIDGVTKTNESKFLINVVTKKPTINTLSFEKKTQGDKTPIDVELRAEGALDPDGNITNFQFWYYDPLEPDKKLSVVDNGRTDHATLTIETKGEENEEREYVFCLSLTDNDNTTATCQELFKEKELPKLKVKNGPNKAPIAAFNVNRSSGKVGEEFIFSSSSSDPDGRIVKYVWDLEGDGFQNDNPTDLATVTHRYERKSPSSGYRVKLKVIDDKGAQGFSKEIPIFVSAKSNPPTAVISRIEKDVSFEQKVRFFSNSRADTQSGARIVKWKWDFDTLTEPASCRNPQRPEYCDNDKTNDWESFDENPIYEYPTRNNYQVKLIVEDSDGNVSEPVTGWVNMIAGTPGAGGTTVVTPIVKAVLRTIPQSQMENFQGQQKKVLRLPQTSCGEPVTFFWSDSRGDIVLKKIDKNIWFDTSGDGVRDNDSDFTEPDSAAPETRLFQPSALCTQRENCRTTTYLRLDRTGHELREGHFTAFLTVQGRSVGTDTDSVEIVFPPMQDSSRCAGSTLTGSLFQRLGMQNTILFSLVSGVFVVLLGWSAASFFRRGKRRI